jgi:hypothetical protein
MKGCNAVGQWHRLARLDQLPRRRGLAREPFGKRMRVAFSTFPPPIPAGMTIGPCMIGLMKLQIMQRNSCTVRRRNAIMERIWRVSVPFMALGFMQRSSMVHFDFGAAAYLAAGAARIRGGRATSRHSGAAR